MYSSGIAPHPPQKNPVGPVALEVPGLLQQLHLRVSRHIVQLREHFVPGAPMFGDTESDTSGSKGCMLYLPNSFATELLLEQSFHQP